MQRLTLRRDLREIDRLTSTVERFGREQGWTREAIFAFVLSLEELFTNAVQHGFPEMGSPAEPEIIRVELDAAPGRGSAVFEDNGRAFNPLEYPAADPAAVLEQRGVGGLGVFLVGKMMSSVQYVRVGGFNRLVLQKHFPAGGPGLTNPNSHPIPLPPCT